MTEITVNQTRFHVHEQGTGPAILFVHGFPLDHTMWEGQFDEFAATHRVIAPDLRGFGQSDVSEETVSMEQFADDLYALLQAMNVATPIVLCGLSMGGYIAWEFVRKYPEALQGLILCDTKATADTAEGVTNREKMAKLVLRHGPESISDAMLPSLICKATFQERPELPQKIKTFIERTEVAGIVAALRGMAQRPDSTDLLPQIDCPCLVLVGEDDQLSPVDVMRSIADALPDADFAVIEDAGHMAPLENASATNAVIRRFLQRLEG